MSDRGGVRALANTVSPIYEDLYRGLARARETTGPSNPTPGSRRTPKNSFPYTEATLHTLIFLAAREYSLPLTFTWGIEGPKAYNPNIDAETSLRPTNSSYTEVAADTKAHHKLAAKHQRAEASAPFQPASESDPEATSQSTRDSHPQPSRSRHTPSIATLERFYTPYIRRLQAECRDRGHWRPQSVCERSFRIDAIGDRLPTEFATLLRNGYEVLSLLETITTDFPRNVDSFQTLNSVTEPHQYPGVTTRLVDRYTRLETLLNTILYQSMCTELLDVLDGPEAQTLDSSDSPQEDDRRNQSESAEENNWGHEIIEALEISFDVSTTIYRAVIADESSLNSRKQAFDRMAHFYRETTWPLLANCVSTQVVQGPHGERMRDAERRTLDERFPKYEAQVARFVQEIQDIRNRR